MKIFNLVVWLTLLSSLAFAEDGRISNHAGEKIVVSGFSSRGGSFKIFIEHMHKYAYENFIEKPVYKLVSLSDNGEVLETREFDIRETPSKGGCGGNVRGKSSSEECELQIRSTLFSIYMKKLPNITRFEFRKGDELVAKKTVSKKFFSK